jgi:hypothetical protein
MQVKSARLVATPLFYCWMWCWEAQVPQFLFIKLRRSALQRYMC